MSNRNRISWTVKDQDGSKREIRVHIARGGMRWQFKGEGDERWDTARPPQGRDWDALEDILQRRAQRGRALNLLETVRRARKQAGA